MFNKYLPKNRNNLDAILLTGSEQKYSATVDVSPEESFYGLEELLPQDIISNILEYTLHDFEGIYQSPKFIKRIFKNDPQLAEIILLLSQRDYLDRLVQTLILRADQRFKKGSMVLRVLAALPMLTGLGALFWYANELNDARYAAAEFLLQAEKFILQNCSTITLEDFIVKAYSACEWSAGGIVMHFNCSQDLVDKSNYAVACQNANRTSNAHFGIWLAIILTILISACVLYILKMCSICPKETNPLAVKYIPEEQRQALSALLDSDNWDLLTIEDLKQELQNRLHLAIDAWKMANPEAGFGKDLSCLLNHSSGNRSQRERAMENMIYGPNGYLARKGQFLFPKEPGESQVVTDAVQCQPT